jgi:tetratricopeptide (TPR) repeat protein
LGTLFARSGQTADALAALDQAANFKQQLIDLDPRDPKYRDAMASNHINLAVLYGRSGRLTYAETHMRAARADLERLTGEFPTVIDYTLHYAAASANLGYLLGNGGQLAEALECLNKAITVAEAVKRRTPDSQPTQSILRNAYWGRAFIFDELGRTVEADADWQRALDLDQQSGQYNSGILRAEAYLRRRQLAEAVAVANSFADTKPTEGETLYRLGRIYAALANATPADDTQRGQLIGRSIHCLDKALPSGFLSIPGIRNRLRTDPVFETVRSHREFGQLLNALNKPPN